MCASTASVRVRPPSPDQCRRGGTGRRTRSRAWRPQGRGGSKPPAGTNRCASTQTAKRVGLSPIVCPFDLELAHTSMPSWGNTANPPRSDRGEPTGKCAFESRRGYQQQPLLVEQEVTAASNAAAVKASRFDSGGADHTHRRQAHTDERAPDKREAASANLAPATNDGASSNGRAAALQAADECSTHSAPTIDVREHVQRCAPLITEG